MLLSSLIDAAKKLRLKNQKLEMAWLSPEPEGAVYKTGAPFDLIAETDRAANVATGLVHARVDAIIRGRVKPQRARLVATDDMLCAEVMLIKRLREGLRTRHSLQRNGTVTRYAEAMKLTGLARAIRAIRNAREEMRYG